jgi:anaerobic ribonucleoside-triphosphate reductase activating protein
MNGRIARICTSFIDVPDKISIAVYFAGCSLRCKDCHSKDLWDPESGKIFTIEKVVEKINKHKLAEYVVFVGGEPTDQIDFLINICKQITNKPKALYTGREFEVLPAVLLDNVDLIICGQYKSEFHVGGWPASSNQRVFKREGSKWNCQNTH